MFVVGISAGILIAGPVIKAITVAGEFCKEKKVFFSFSVQYDGDSEYWIKNESV